MKDSCRPSKLDPGLAAAYSIPRSRTTWTMRSEPGRVIRRTSAAGGRIFPASRKSCASVGAGAPDGDDGLDGLLGACASPRGWGDTSAAAPAAPAAAFFRKPRRPTEVFGDFAITIFSAFRPTAWTRTAR